MRTRLCLGGAPGHLPHVDDEHVLGQPPESFEDGGEGAVLDVLEDEVEVVLGAYRLVEADDLRVRQVPQQLHLRLDGTGGGDRHACRKRGS